MPAAEIIAIGTELLLGQTQDTNTSWIARTLNDSGIDIYRTSMVGDNEKRIAEIIREALQRTDIIITTGGLGPTVDDPTRQAVAQAFDTSIEFHPNLWEEIQNRFKAYGRSPSDNNKKQAFLPAGAAVIHNPVGTAPAFYIEKNDKLVFSLPGVPSEMKTLLLEEVVPRIVQKFNLKSAIVTRVLHVIGMGESSVDELIADLETMSNPTVGLAAHPGQVDIRITAKADTRQEAGALIEPIEMKINALLGDAIYGTDQTSLREVIAGLLERHNLRLLLTATGACRELAESIAGQLTPNAHLISGDLKASEPLEINSPDKGITDLRLSLSASLEGNQGVDLRAEILNNEYQEFLRFGGHSSLFPLWAANQVFNFLRGIILKEKGAI